MKTFTLCQGSGGPTHKFVPFDLAYRISTDNERKKNYGNASNITDVFKATSRGKLLIEGPNSGKLIQNLTGGDGNLSITQFHYCSQTSYVDGVSDDLIIYRLAAERYLAVFNAANSKRHIGRINQLNHCHAALTDKSADLMRVVIEGQLALHTLQRMTYYRLDMIQESHFIELLLYGIPHILLANLKYSGAEGFELYVPQEFSAQLVKGIKKIAANFQDRPRVTLGC